MTGMVPDKCKRRADTPLSKARSSLEKADQLRMMDTIRWVRTMDIGPRR